MNTEKYKTKQEIANEKGFSLRTFQRMLERVGLVVPRGLISPDEQKKINEKLNCKNHED